MRKDSENGLQDFCRIGSLQVVHADNFDRKKKSKAVSTLCATQSALQVELFQLHESLNECFAGMPSILYSLQHLNIS